MRRSTLSLVLAAVAALALSGCSGKDPGRPVATGGDTASAGTSSSTSTASSGSNGVPPISQPLNISKYTSSPCNFLTADQLSQLGSTRKPGSVRQVPEGQECYWHADDALKGIDVGAYVMTKSHGLNGLYANRGSFAVFRPTEVGGYPAVSNDITNGQGQCATAVGVADGSGFTVEVFVNDHSSADYQNSCAVSERIANTVLGNVKAGG